MDDKRFWDVIAVACQRGANDQDPTADWGEGLAKQLATLCPEDVVRFGWWFDQKTDALHTIDHWGAAYLINGGASDDGFFYWCCWLVGMGKQVYDAALAAPDFLADVVDPDMEYEASIYSAASIAWENRGLDVADFEKAYGALGSGTGQGLTGEDWSFDDNDEYRRRLPRLAALYLDAEDEEDD